MSTGDIKICIEEAGAFLEVSQTINKNCGSIILDSMIYPLVVNAAFSCELSLKALLMIQDKSEITKGHKLAELFSKLEDQYQSKIESTASTELIIPLEDALNEFNDTFLEWRYAFEKGVGAHYLELVKLAKILYECSNEIYSSISS